jgi:predicted metal-dependent enzyme (double-stranded beta helix superfamily)
MPSPEGRYKQIEGEQSMSDYGLEQFIDECRRGLAKGNSPADIVENIAPSMYRLLNGSKDFLKPEHFRSEADHYARNAIHIEADGLLSLYALVWRPGQWTPIHDHGTWGVVGVHEGMLNERNYIRTDRGDPQALEEIELARGGVIMLSPGAVTSFVPNPDHIHMTGNPSPDQHVVSLHLYGSAMAGFHVYDCELGTRKWIEVTHNES